MSGAGGVSQGRLDRWFGTGSDTLIVALLGLGLAALYLPTYWDLSHTIWATDEQGHGPIILAVSLWLLYKRRDDFAALPARPANVPGALLIVLSLALYVLGRSQGIVMFEVASQIGVISALLLLFKGPAALRLALFPLFFMIFMVPLPGALVAAVTTPLKSAVSAVATAVLYALGYPIARTGVMLSVGQYQLLVADACAGLNSLFTLEALGLLYMNLMHYTSVLRNVLLALVIVPIGFVANVVRVMVLVLVTVHFGDAAGQGFAHDFAGLVLFVVALLLILGVDALFARIVAWREAR